MKVIITGFAGFIGTNFTKYLLQKKPNWQVYGIDAYTYAARPNYLLHWAAKNIKNEEQFFAKKMDLRDEKEVQNAVEFIQPSIVVHLAAESHVCNSIKGPREFMHTNILGTWNLIEACRKTWANDKNCIFLHVSTDEVFGQLAKDSPKFSEATQIAPRTPYSASKAASDHIVASYHHTYGLNTRVTNCTNNFGFNQHAEKLIPKTVHKLLKDENMTVFGSGDQIRDWIHVDDHSEALMKVLANGKAGERYCIGGNRELSNMEMMEKIAEILRNEIHPRIELKMSYTEDRPHDDFRYAVNTAKIERLGWAPRLDLFEERLRQTVLYEAEKAGVNIAEVYKNGNTLDANTGLSSPR